MEIYLVGGAVRDQLLNLPVKEKDWVVVGATVEEMLQKGYRQVGKDFPVFLHPKTNEEYALARVERKVGRGYTGFDFDASPKVTLEEDLRRRDLTINAIAQTADGKKIIDPYQGQKDLEKKILRHVSEAFVEDPVRILRVGRFAARFAQYGFSLAPETLELMKKMVKSGEVDALVAERVWKELERALQEKNPEQFFQVLEDCDALPVLFPDLKTENIKILEQTKFPDAEIRLAALLYDFSPAQIKKLCERYRAPSVYRELALLLAKHYPDYLKAEEFTPEQLLDLLQSTDAFRREERFQKFLKACGSINKVKLENFTPVNANILQDAFKAAKTADINTALNNNLVGKEIAESIYKIRLQAIRKSLKK